MLLWTLFFVIFIALFILDLRAHRGSEKTNIYQDWGWTLLWILAGVSFGFIVWWIRGSQAAAEYFAGYGLEKGLSTDNIFVFVMTFTFFNTPEDLRHRVLIWGIIGALIMRTIFILAGTALIVKFGFLFYVFGALLVVVSVWLAFFSKGEKKDIDNNPLVRMIRKVLPVTSHWAREFIILVEGKRHATPTLIVLLTMEWTDLIFAADSIPAIFSVTTDRFIIITSNYFALLGLRSLFFVLEHEIKRFKYLPVGVNAILFVAGMKMLLKDIYHIPLGAAMAVIGVILFVSVIASLLSVKNGEQKAG